MWMYLLTSEAGQAGDKWANPNMSEEQRDPALQSWYRKRNIHQRDWKKADGNWSPEKDGEHVSTDTWVLRAARMASVRVAAE